MPFSIPEQINLQELAESTVVALCQLVLTSLLQLRGALVLDIPFRAGLFLEDLQDLISGRLERRYRQIFVGRLLRMLQNGRNCPGDERSIGGLKRFVPRIVDCGSLGLGVEIVVTMLKILQT